ncbi:hypothetical protein BJ912DRAFT_981261 [Pholiota molesta]|nr:hypothetical protein BJ912DRAFT_981261 [Pholiota molesta]
MQCRNPRPAACWIVLWAFGRAVNMKWGPVMYCIGNTLLQGIFCLGMIYKMDPYQMPRAFCIAQTVMISFAFSLATSLTVLKPKTWGEGERALQWKNIYAVPTIAFPLLASIVNIVLILKFDSVQPSDDMHCDSTSPEWVRLVGYAGLPFIMAWPALYLSIKSIIRISKTNRHLQRARPISDDFNPVPPRRQSTQLPPSVFTPPAPTRPTPAARREAIQPGIASPALSARKFHLPFKAPGAAAAGYAPKRTSSSLATADGPLVDDASSAMSRVSVSFPTFVNPDAPPLVVGKEDLEEIDWEDGSSQGKGTRNSEQATMLEEEEDEDDEDGDVVAKEEYVMSFSGDSTCAPRPASMLHQQKSRRQTPNLAPAVWRIILFQVAFTSIQCWLERTPAPLGTQHFALLLAAWGPVIVFGHLPAVRRNLIPWRPIS